MQGTHAERRYTHHRDQGGGPRRRFQEDARLRAPGEIQYALLSVSDTATGMDEQTKEQIFVPLFTTKELGKGTGLGLSTVYGTVKQHGGYITLYSEQDLGTSFHIYLPVSANTRVEAEVSAEPVKRGSEKILVAEDNKAVRRLV